MNQLVFLLLIIILAIGLPLLLNFSNKFEGFSNYSLDIAMGPVPESQTQVLVQDTYPPIGLNQISNNSASDIWMDYPVFQLGSYDQTTNNIRYPDNPDEGTCMPASMCGALYHDKKQVDNSVSEAVDNNGTRIGCFTTSAQLIDSLPFRTNGANVLY
jgi:hypothetical protein